MTKAKRDEDDEQKKPTAGQKAAATRAENKRLEQWSQEQADRSGVSQS